MQAERMSEMESCLNECFVSSHIVLAAGLRPPPEPTAVQRIIKEAANKGHSVASAMSLETGWSFLKAADRRAAKEVVTREKPYLLALAFPCGLWSALMRLNPSNAFKHEDLSGSQSSREEAPLHPGHRSNRRLARSLAIAGAPPEAIAAAKSLQCSICQERRPPRVTRPATLPTPKDAGDQVP